MSPVLQPLTCHVVSCVFPAWRGVVSDPPMRVLDTSKQSLYLTHRLNTMPSDSLSSTFAALADPTRRAILGRLARGDAAVTTLARPFHMSLPAVSKHLKVLQCAGLVTRGRDAQWRPCRLRARPLRELTEWAEPFRRFWEGSFDRLEAYLREVHPQPDEKRRRTARPIRRATRGGNRGKVR